MTDREREYLERNRPDLLRPENLPAAIDFLNSNAGFLSDWARNTVPESNYERFERERARRESEGAGGW